MTVVQFSDIESETKRWLLTTSVAPLILKSGGIYSAYLAMPLSAPAPSVIISMVGGGPTRSKDIPQADYRISFDCWGSSRDQAGTIARTLIAELESLPRTGGYVDLITGTYIGSAQVLLLRWQPDPDSDKPRYIVDALITTVT